MSRPKKCKLCGKAIQPGHVTARCFTVHSVCDAADREAAIREFVSVADFILNYRGIGLEKLRAARERLRKAG